MTRRWSVGGWLFVRLLAAAHLVAFVSFLRQWRGLIGPDGILPAGPFFAAVHARYGAVAYWKLPSLCWVCGTHAGIPLLAAAGIVVALLVFVGVAPKLGLVFLWADYLSLVAAGRVFYEFQWDGLLLETTLLAIFAVSWSWLPLWRLQEPPRAARWLLAWLLFRLIFLSGVVKLASGDPTWSHLTALLHHFHTQPLPTPLAWYADKMPGWALRSSCALMFAIELGAPFLLWAGTRLRRIGALAIVFLQVVIALTGNYTFFNLLTVALCVLALDDAFWLGAARRLLSARFRETLPAAAASALRPRSGPLLQVFAGFVVAVTAVEILADYAPVVAASPATATIIGLVAPFRSLNTYGLFAVMTTERPELIFQGSDDGRIWQDYEFPYKPGDLRRRPEFVAPGQPRLDWQLWFAALGTPDQSPWVGAFVVRLLRGDPDVLALLAVNPFPRHPPQYIRALRYDYRFSSRADRRASGRWWERDFDAYYLDPAGLAP